MTSLTKDSGCVKSWSHGPLCFKHDFFTFCMDLLMTTTVSDFPWRGTPTLKSIYRVYSCDKVIRLRLSFVFTRENSSSRSDNIMFCQYQILNDVDSTFFFRNCRLEYGGKLPNTFRCWRCAIERTCRSLENPACVLWHQGLEWRWFYRCFWRIDWCVLIYFPYLRTEKTFYRVVSTWLWTSNL